MPITFIVSGPMPDVGWILATHFWNDAGYWQDTAFWND